MKRPANRQVHLVCSEWKKRQHGRRKYLACSDLRVTAKQIISAYQFRWQIEIFHKEVKQYLGFEDVATTSFSSVTPHVHRVYCADIVLQMDIPGCPKSATAICAQQAYIQCVLDTRDVARMCQQLTQFGGLRKFKKELTERLSA